MFSYFSGVEELQGGVVVNIINITSSASNYSAVHEYDPHTSDVIITGLTPTTLYDMVLTFDLHGGESISSGVVSASTLDGGELNEIYRHKLCACVSVSMLGKSSEY